VKKPLERAKGPQLPLAEMDPECWKKSPFTRGFFLDTRYADSDDERVPGSLTLRAEPGRWCVTLRDPTTCQQLFLAAPVLADLWKLVEAALSDSSAPWAEDQFALARRPKPRKK